MPNQALEEHANTLKVRTTQLEDLSTLSIRIAPNSTATFIADISLNV